VKRQNFWYPTIYGKKEVIDYFESKALIDKHHLNLIARTAYIDGMPAGRAEKRMVTAEGTMAGGEPIPAGSQISLWYEEHEEVLLIYENFYDDPTASVHLELDAEGLIKNYWIYNPDLFAFIDHEACHKRQDFNDLVNAMKYEVALTLFDEGYQVVFNQNNFTLLPHLHAIKEDQGIPVLIFPDISPFKGVIDLEMAKGIFNRASVNLQFAALIEAEKTQEGYRILSMVLKDLDKVMIKDMT
jgi:hypothetical protein